MHDLSEWVSDGLPAMLEMNDPVECTAIGMLFRAQELIRAGERKASGPSFLCPVILLLEERLSVLSMIFHALLNLSSHDSCRICQTKID
jgi:hypothetical protein